MFKVIIAGGRDYHDMAQLTSTMDTLLENKPFVTIISGGAKGADTLGERYAKMRNYHLMVVKPDWDKYGKRAGYLRNETMLHFADAVVCFWNGVSKGTAHMVHITMKSGKPLRVIRYMSAM